MSLAIIARFEAVASAQQIRELPGVLLEMPLREALVELERMETEAWQDVTGEAPLPPKAVTQADECFDLKQAGSDRNREMICVGGTASRVAWIARDKEGDAGSVEDVITALLDDFGKSPSLLRTAGKKPVASLVAFRGLDRSTLAAKHVNLYWVFDGRGAAITLPKSCAATLARLSWAYWVSEKSPASSDDHACPQAITIVHAELGWRDRTQVDSMLTGIYRRSTTTKPK